MDSPYTLPQPQPQTQGRRPRIDMAMPLAESQSIRFSSLIYDYGDRDGRACLERREMQGRLRWDIGDVIVWSVDMKLRRMPRFCNASSEQRDEIEAIVSFLGEVAALTGAYHVFETKPFPSELNFAAGGNCRLMQDLRNVCGSQLYGPRAQRLLVLRDYPTEGVMKTLGCSSLFFEKVLSRERDCQFLLLMDCEVLSREFRPDDGRGISGIDVMSPSIDLLSDRIQAAQSTEFKLPKYGSDIKYFKDRGYDHSIEPDPTTGLCSLNVKLQEIFDVHKATPHVPKNVLVVVGDDPTRTETVLKVLLARFKQPFAEEADGAAAEDPADGYHIADGGTPRKLSISRGSDVSPKEVEYQGLIPNLAFTFLQCGKPGLKPGVFECCRDDGGFCTKLVMATEAEIPSALLEVLRPSMLDNCSLHKFLRVHLPERPPLDAIGGYRVRGRGSCVPAGGSINRPCTPCRTVRMCNPGGCNLC